MNRTHRWPHLLLACLTPLVLITAGCGGGGGGDSAPPPVPQFTLGGSISGLTGSGLVLANGTDTIAVDAGATAFTLPTAITSGSAFSVTVQTQPVGQTCAVADGTGSMGNANVTSAAVTCITNTYTVGGSISGLISNGLVLANGSDTLAVDANTTSFTLPTAVDFGSTFSVSVQTQPTGLTCSVADGSGTVAEANVSSVVVTCNANAFNLGGSITGLTNSGLVLANGSDTLAVAAGATSFTMPTVVAFGSNFNVTVQGKAVDQTCTVGSGSGVMGAADVAGVVVSCGPASFTVSTLAGTGSAGSANGSGTVAQFRAPHGVAFDSSGNVFVADFSSNKIRRVTPAGVVSTFAGSGASSSVDGQGTAASFNSPRQVAVDSSGTVYVAESEGHKIRKITPDGVVSTLAGSGVQGSADGAGSAASFRFPFGIAVDSIGNVYVGDLNNNKVRKISPDGVVSTLAGSGASGGANGTGAAASFNRPAGVAVDVDGNVYVVEVTGQRVRKITPAGVVSTLAGSGVQGSADGNGTAASFRNAEGIAVDGDGNVLVADTGNHKIRRITPAGVVSTLAGSGAQDSAEGDVAAASFNGPKGIAVDASGTVLVGDTGNNKIRKIAQD